MNAHRSPAAYLRRSEDGGITKEDEIAALRTLAAREGHNGDLSWYDDWGHSADEAKGAQRELARLIADMRAGRIGVVYAGKLDRLARSVQVFARFAAAAREHDVRLVTVAEGDLSEAAVDDDPFRWASRQFMVTIAEMELRTIKARTRRAQRVRRGRADVMGPPPYGYRFVRGADGRRVVPHRLEPDPAQPIPAVLDAFRAAGSFNGAAAILNRDRVPTRNGKVAADGRPVWWANTVRVIVEREAPGMVPPKVRRGAPAVGRFALSGMLVCGACRRVLTAKRDRGGVYYVCGNAARDLDHPRPLQVAERAIMPWIIEEADRFDPGGEDATGPDDRAERRAAVIEDRRRLALTYRRGAMDDVEYEAEDARLVAELDALAGEGITVDVEPVIWDTGPEHVNAQLRALWDHVELGADLRPVRAEWRVPEWRRAD